ncbi:hypothetical protein GQ597_05780 [Gilliamella sp. Pra-s65]|uniref:DUF6708 domain-containing protein n=1 Tax=unclassified Gilliamella TaxID=2685620 RepID=UPI00136594B8|nr:MULTISPECIES: DUF6708 domain-containing protein [unclassified Gilliamella]MWN90208.1 hypothetical protein [Gilliamella sp. Pra-s65]MWP73109.1 hypothetical protein [Gilliamella sp. Pra-s52]
MPSKYRPQIFGWFGDLDKGPYSVPLHDHRLSYANNNYCAFIRKVSSDQIFYLCIYIIAVILLFIAVVLLSILTYLCNPILETNIFLVALSGVILCFIAMYLVIPEIYQNLFSHRGSPIIFNRKTGKVYVNESDFFNFKVLRHPAVFLQPKKRRIKEYDWGDLHGVIIHNMSRNALTSTVLMVCQPGTHQVIDHIMLDPARAGAGSTFVWGWINSFMVYYKSANIDDGEYKSDQEVEFKAHRIDGQGWPEWMVEAFNATSQEELAEIKQRHHVK